MLVGVEVGYDKNIEKKFYSMSFRRSYYPEARITRHVCSEWMV